MGKNSRGNTVKPLTSHKEHKTQEIVFIMISKLSLYLLISLCVLHNVFAEQESHSLQKRQTTVTYAQTWEEVVASFVSASVTAGIVFLAWYTVAPLFGYTLEERRLDYDDYSGYYNNYYQEDPANNYYYYQGRSLQDTGLVTRAAKMLFNSIDVVDTAFNYMDIEEEVCRLKTVCEMESYAVNHPLARLAINTINSSLKGLERYQDAVDAGIEGQDCALLYDQCPYSYFGY